MAQKTFSREIGGKDLIIETGKFAGQTNGACTVRYGDTVVLATAVMSQTLRDGISYFPLLVDYEERLYAAGKIKGSRFIKREGRATDEAILTSRMIDRSIRPLFPEQLRNDVQVVITVLSVDQENDPDVLSLIGASCALAMSNIPWNGPLAGSRVGIIEGEWALNPTYAAREKADLDLVVAGTKDRVIMIEAGGNQVTEDKLFDAIEFSQKHTRKVVELIEEVVAAVGSPKEMPASSQVSDEEQASRTVIAEKVKSLIGSRLAEYFNIKDKAERGTWLNTMREDLDAKLKADNDVSKEQRAQSAGILESLLDHEAERLVLEEDRRVDGRKLDEIRPLSAEAGILPRTHGSGLFQRGETQALSIVTLGSPGDEQTIDTMEESGTRRYMHHYNFPGFSVGEVKPMRGPGRREIGHGALAEKAILPVLPDKEAFPYTIRVVSEILSSNGSTSQASACGSSLALMDAGVPITAAVAGLAMGIVLDEKSGKYKILTDMQGVEDHWGMDFKVAGTRNGITAVQVDIKISGLTMDMIREALDGAKKARLKILDVMASAIAEPRKELSQYAPRITSLRIDPEKIREVIGRGGETINKIIDECGGRDVTKIDIEDDGLVMVTSHNSEMANKAIEWIKNLTHEIQPGEEYEGKVLQIVKDRMSGGEIGAVVELSPGRDGMVHISQFSEQRIRDISSFINVGDTLKVRVAEVDKERGRISLTTKGVQGNSFTVPESAIDNSPADHSRPHRGMGGPRRSGGSFRR